MKNIILTTAMVLACSLTAYATNSSNKEGDVGRDVALSIYKTHGSNKDFLSCLETVAFFPMRSSAMGVSIDTDLMATIILACDQAATNGFLTNQPAEELEKAVKRNALSLDGYLVIIHSLYSSASRSTISALGVSQACSAQAEKKNVDFPAIMKKQYSKALSKFLKTDIKSVLKEAHVSDAYQTLLVKRYDEIQKEILKK